MTNLSLISGKQDNKTYYISNADSGLKDLMIEKKVKFWKEVSDEGTAFLFDLANDQDEFLNEL